MKKKSSPKSTRLFYIFLSLLCLSFSTVSQAKEIKTVAVLPFEIIAPEDLSYVQDGVVQMLHSRLVWKDKVSVIEQKKTDSHFNQIKNQNSDRRIESLAKSLGSDYIVTGSITHFANAFSIDTRIYDIRNKQWMAFSEQSADINDLIPKMSAISAKINKKVFDRETVIYNDLVRQEQEKAEQWKRQNPERLMPEMPAGEREKKSSLWRFWEYL